MISNPMDPNCLEKKNDVLNSIQDYVYEKAVQLKPAEARWQPADLLPIMSQDDWSEQIQNFRIGSNNLTDEILIVVIGNMITEEALPSYQTWFNRLNGVQDTSGMDKNGWSEWSRNWTAQENRHGEILKFYLYLSGRVDMKSIEVTIQNLIRNGFNPKEKHDPYRGLIYTSFQEAATKLSHTRIGDLSNQAGDKLLSKICSNLASEEAIHEEAYKGIMAKIFKIDPEGATLAFGEMMKAKIVMPGVNMEFSGHKDIFQHYSNVVFRLGVYTTEDYAEIIKKLIKFWSIENLQGLKGEASKAQDFLGNLPRRYLRLAQRKLNKYSKVSPKSFPWIFNRTV